MADYNVGQAYLTVLPSLTGFGEDVRRQLAEQDLSATADIKPNLDAAELDAKIAEVKAELEGLTAEAKIGADDADALAKIELLKAELDDLQSKRAQVTLKADDADAVAKMDDVKLKADELDGKTATVKVKADTSDAQSKFSLLGSAIAGLGPALIPIGAAAGGGLVALAGGALLGAGAMGVLKLATGGVGSAVSALEQAQTQQGTNSAQQAASQVSAANSVANAQDSLRTAVQNVSIAEQTAARNVASAVEQQKQAEQSLTDAVRTQTSAQQALTQARIDAQNALINSTLSIQDNALAQRSAQLQLEQAQQNLTTLAPTATLLQRQQAQLAIDQAQQQITDTKAQGQQLQQQNATLQAQGVNGSQQVVSAQNAIYTANEQVASAQQRLKDATAAVTQAQVDGNRQVAQAQQAVVTATRALQDAMASQTAQAQANANANNAAAAALAALSPEQRQFAEFLVSLQPQLNALKDAAASGILPGLEDGIKALLPIMPLIIGLITAFSTAIGNLARDAGQALNDPFWRGFITFLTGEAGPSFQAFGSILGNLATGFAGLFEASKPVFDGIGAGLVTLTGEFATFGENAGTNSFQAFLQYIETEGPKVIQFLGDLFTTVGHLLVALAPIGDVVLGIVDGFLKLINAIPTPWLTPLLAILISVYLGFQALQVVKTITKGISDFSDTVKTAVTWLKSFGDTEATATVTTEANTVATEAKTVATEEQDIAYSVTAVDLDALTVANAAETVALEADTAATEGATVATGALDVAMDANPIGAVILALTALVLVVVEVWQHFDTLKAIVGDVWNFLGSVISGTYHDVIEPVFNAFKAVIDAIPVGFQLAVDNLKRIWGGIVDIVKAPVNFVIDPVYDKGIAGLWNDIAGIFGLPQLPQIATLAAGGVLGGYAPGQDTVPAMLSPGEGVLVPEAVRALGPDFVHWANSNFSSRPVGSSGLANGVQHFADGGIAGFLTSLVTNPANAVAAYFSGATSDAGNTPGTGELHDAVAAVPGKFIGAVVGKAKSYAASLFTGSGNVGAGVEQWRATGLAALAAEGQSPDNITALLAQMTTESGGNPTIVNTTDSNWVAGTPSVGLMQVIGPTYAAYKDPRFDVGPYEYGTSVNPMANITAATRYAAAAYGSLGAAWGHGHGYDSGGWLPPGASLAFNGTRAPEAVLTGEQWRTVQQAATQPPINVNVYPRAHHSEAEIAEQVSRQLALTLRSAAL